MGRWAYFGQQDKERLGFYLTDPSEVSISRVSRASHYLGFNLLKFGTTIREGDNLRGADEGTVMLFRYSNLYQNNSQISRIKEENNIFSPIIR